MNIRKYLEDIKNKVTKTPELYEHTDVCVCKYETVFVRQICRRFQNKATDQIGTKVRFPSG
jgi:hypothetical protein